MSKGHRGKGLKEKPKGGRGICPVCKREGVKVIYEREIDKVKTNVCKICNTKLAKKAKATEVKAAPAAQEAAPQEATPQEGA